MPAPHVLLLFNQPVLPPDHPDAAQEHEILDTVERIRRVLRDAQFETSVLGVGQDPSELVANLQRIRPDVVYNLFEGLATCGETEAVVAGLLEWLKIPYTGSTSAALSLGRDKFRSKSMLIGAGLPTAAFKLIENLSQATWDGQWPAIVKPAMQDASVGIEQASVVSTPKQLYARAAVMLERYCEPLLVEQFIRGREFLIGLLEEESAASPSGLTMLPLAEIQFVPCAEPLWPIYSYDAKWKMDTLEYAATPLQVPVYLEYHLLNKMRQIAEKAYRLIGCRDYARVDIRLTQIGEPYILEVNPNPFLNSIAIIDGLKSIGRQHEQFIVDLAWTALKRAGKPLPLTKPRPPYADSAERVVG